MKKYIKCTYDENILEMNSGLTVIQTPTWEDLIEDIESETDFSVSSEYIDNPQKYIFLYDSAGNEYEAEITKYYGGDYELRFENVHSTGWNSRQRNMTSFEASTNVAASELFEGSNKDPLLQLEHYVDLAINEAWSLHRSYRSSNPFLSSRGKAFAEHLEETRSTIRGARKYFMKHQNDYYEDTEKTMREDSSRYLED